MCFAEGRPKGTERVAHREGGGGTCDGGAPEGLPPGQLCGPTRATGGPQTPDQKSPGEGGGGGCKDAARRSKGNQTDHWAASFVVLPAPRLSLPRPCSGASLKMFGVCNADCVQAFHCSRHVARTPPPFAFAGLRSPHASPPDIHIPVPSLWMADACGAVSAAWRSGGGGGVAGDSGMLAQLLTATAVPSTASVDGPHNPSQTTKSGGCPPRPGGGGGGGLACRLWCTVLVCSRRRQLADRPSLPFPWTLSLHRQWCPSASHRPVPFLSLLGLSFPLYFPCANRSPGLSLFHCTVLGPHGGGQVSSPLAGGGGQGADPNRVPSRAPPPPHETQSDIEALCQPPPPPRDDGAYPNVELRGRAVVVGTGHVHEGVPDPQRRDDFRKVQNRLIGEPQMICDSGGGEAGHSPRNRGRDVQGPPQIHRHSGGPSAGGQPTAVAG